jgi:hypothetical protein
MPASARRPMVNLNSLKILRLSSSELAAIDALDWYEAAREMEHYHPNNPRPAVWVKRVALEPILGPARIESLASCGAAMTYIDHILHRWDDDGFYHA